MTGKRFGMWTVLRVDGKNKYGAYKWLCKCDCGTVRSVVGHTLRRGLSTSCGCAGIEKRCEAAKKAVTKHGGRNDRLYQVWNGIKDRCYNPKSKYFQLYGGRGIFVCDEWRGNYQAFKNWAYKNGYDSNAKKGQCTLDRVNNDSGYSPENCRWANMVVQCNNRSSNHVIEYNGVKHTITEWSRITGIRKDTLRRRLVNYGWSTERALTESVHNTGHHQTHNA